MIVVTGATGFLGRYLVQYLSEVGEHVVAAGRTNKYESFFQELGVPFVAFDVCDPGAFSVLPAGPVSAFVHLAGVIPARADESQPDIYLRTNTLGTLYALEYCRRHSIQKFLYTTTLYEAIEHTELPIDEAMGRNYSLSGDHALYVVSKVAAAELVEHYSREYGIQGVVLRLTGLLGYGRQEGYWAEGVFHPSAFEVFYRRAKAGLALEIWGAHKARRDSLYVKDAVRAIYMAVTSDQARGLYVIGSGVGRTNEEEALAFASVFGTDDRPVPVTYRPEKPEKPKSYYFDIGKAKRDLGWEPVYDYSATLIDYDSEVRSGRFAP